MAAPSPSLPAVAAELSAAADARKARERRVLFDKQLFMVKTLHEEVKKSAETHQILNTICSLISIGLTAVIAASTELKIPALARSVMAVVNSLVNAISASFKLDVLSVTMHQVKADLRVFLFRLMTAKHRLEADELDEEEQEALTDEMELLLEKIPISINLRGDTLDSLLEETFDAQRLKKKSGIFVRREDSVGDIEKPSVDHYRQAEKCHGMAPPTHSPLPCPADVEAPPEEAAVTTVEAAASAAAFEQAAAAQIDDGVDDGVVEASAAGVAKLLSEKAHAGFAEDEPSPSFLSIVPGGAGQASLSCLEIANSDEPSAAEAVQLISKLAQPDAAKRFLPHPQGSRALAEEVLTASEKKLETVLAYLEELIKRLVTSCLKLIRIVNIAQRFLYWVVTFVRVTETLLNAALIIGPNLKMFRIDYVLMGMSSWLTVQKGLELAFKPGSTLDMINGLQRKLLVLHEQFVTVAAELALLAHKHDHLPVDDKGRREAIWRAIRKVKRLEQTMLELIPSCSALLKGWNVPKETGLLPA